MNLANIHKSSTTPIQARPRSTTPIHDPDPQTRLTVERWERNGKSGYALSVQRDKEQINVPVQAEQFLYAAEFLRHLSLQQAWVEEPECSAG